MPELMSRAQLIADHKASLNDAAGIFVAAGDADFARHVAVAAIALGEKRPRQLVGSITLEADRADYDAPALFVAFKSHLWGIAPIKAPLPWERGYPGRLPDVRTVESDDDPVTWKLHLDPPPTAAQIAALGPEFRFYYRGGHVVADDAKKTTVRPADRGLLILRAQAEAMRELAMRNVVKPVMVRDGISSSLKNGTPTYLFEKFMQEFNGVPAGGAAA